MRTSCNRRRDHNAHFRTPYRYDLSHPMSLGGLAAGLVGRKARSGRLGPRVCDRRFRSGTAGARARYRRADQARFEPVGVLFLSGDDVRMRPRTLLEVGDDTARINMRSRATRAPRSVVSRAAKPMGQYTLVV